MAQLAITAGGAAVGALIGAPFGGALIGAEFGALAGSIIGGIFFPGGTPAQGPRVGDLKIQEANYGKPMPILTGTTRVAGEIIAMSDLVPHAVTTTVGGGLGFGTPQQGVAAYTYSVTMLVSFGIPLLGPAHAITRIWGDNKKMYDKRPNGHRPAHGLRGAKLRVHLGGPSQLPDPWIEKTFGADIASAYRGQVTIALEGLQLADFANHPPNIEAEVVCSGSPAYPYQTCLPSSGTNLDTELTINSSLGLIVKAEFGGLMVAVDTQTLNTIAGPTQVVPNVTGGLAFGTDGYLYSSTFNGNYTPFNKIDPHSLQIVCTIGIQGAFDDANHDGISPPAWVKNRGYPYVLLTVGRGLPTFGSSGAVIISTGQLEALAGGQPAGGNLPMRFVGKTEASGGPDPFCHDWEIDALSLANALAVGTMPLQFDLWGCFGDSASTTCKLYHFTVTDNLIPGGGTTVGGAFGANSIVLVETIDISSAFSVNGVAQLSYTDDGQHVLIINRGSKLVRFDLDSKTVTGAETDIGGVSTRQLCQGPTDGVLYCNQAGSGTLSIFDVLNWTITETVLLGNYFGGGASWSNPQWDERNGTLWIAGGPGAGGQVTEITLDASTSDTVVLGDVVKALCKLGGLTDAELDTSALTQTVRGYAVPRQMSIKDALKPLADVFLFEAYEADFQLKFANLGSGTITAVLTADEIGAYPHTAKRPDPIAITDANQRQIPRRVTVKYINPDPRYEKGLSAAQRPTAVVSTVSELAIDAPVVLKVDEADAVANAWLARSWVNSRKFGFPTSPRFLKLTPTDVVTVADQYGMTHRMALKMIDDGADGIRQVTAVREDPESYVAPAPSGGSGGNGTGAGSQPSTIGHTDAELMDIVLISDLHDGKGFYLAMAPDTGNPSDWIGGVLMKSTDNGVSFVAFQTVSTATIIGRATTALAVPRAWTTWDRLNSVTVRPFDPSVTLASASEINVLNGANLAILGNELIAFAIAVNNGDGTYTLSNLLRGLRGSDPFIGTHATGERFALVDFSKMRNVPDSDFAITRVYKTQSIGDTTILATSQMFNDTGVRLKPLTVAEPQLQTDAEGNLLFSWNRRTRIGGENDWLDGVTTVPLGEQAESYQVDILNGSTVVRTLSTSTPQAAYMLTDQISDFGSAQTTVSAVIYQLSATVGRGFGTSVTGTVVGSSALPVLPNPVNPTPPPGTEAFLIVMEWLDIAPIPANQVIGRFKADSTIVIPAGMGGSVGDAKDAATVQSDIDVRQNGVSIATMRFAATTNAAAFISSAGATLNSGDVLEFIAPASPDATLGRITATVKALQSS